MIGNDDVGKIDLIELLHAVGLLDRPHFHARALHVEKEHRQSLVLRHIGIGARDQEAIIRVMRARGPDFLAVDDPVFALLLRARAQAGDIGSASRLREQLAPDLFAGSELRQIVTFVLLAAIGHYGRAAHAFADLERLRQLAVYAFFLLPDHPLDRRGPPPPVFLPPAPAGPRRRALLLLPGCAAS